MTRYKSSEPIHPKDVIAEYLVDKGWTVTDLARVTGLEFALVAGLCDGGVPVTEDIAEKLGEAFGRPARLWSSLQKQYDDGHRPRVVCLCGSTRFYKEFQEANYNETMAGNIVLTVGHYPHSSSEAHGQTVGCTPEQKIKLDVLHKQKIDMADEILVLNVGGYIGESTRSEIAHAIGRNKPVRWLEAPTDEQLRIGTV